MDASTDATMQERSQTRARMLCSSIYGKFWNRQNSPKVEQIEQRSSGGQEDVEELSEPGETSIL